MKFFRRIQGLSKRTRHLGATVSSPMHYRKTTSPSLDLLELQLLWGIRAGLGRKLWRNEKIIRSGRRSGLAPDTRPRTRPWGKGHWEAGRAPWWRGLEIALAGGEMGEGGVRGPRRALWIAAPGQVAWKIKFIGPGGGLRTAQVKTWRGREGVGGEAMSEEWGGELCGEGVEWVETGKPGKEETGWRLHRGLPTWFVFSLRQRNQEFGNA